tara:strand:- start:18 stop:1520 length:1503 start_codon:yes stop_codon:yes gene_type:complete
VQKLFGSEGFDPLSLDPYLLFDAETSMRGTLEAFTLDLDPANPSSLDVITATRAGIATVTSASGTVVAASPNTVRVDYSLGYPAILVEPSSENLVTHSDFSGGWQDYLINSSAGGGYASQPSRIITATGANAAYYIPVATSNGVSYTASIWARRVSGSGGCNIIYLSSPTAKQSISLTSEFQKFTATFTGKSGGGNVNFGVDIVNSGDSIEIAMPQVEEGSVPTSYIPNPAPISSTLNSVTSFEADGSVGGFSNIHVESIAGISGKEVEVEFEIFDYVSGTAACLMGHAFTPALQVGGSLNANGIYRGVVTADSNNRILFRNNSNTDNFTGKIRNIKVVEVDTSGVRNADDLKITGSAFSDFYNQSEGTFYVESELQRATEVGFQPFLFDADNGDGNRVLLYNETAGDVLGLVRAAGAGYQINLGTHPSVNTLSRTAFSYKSNNLQGSKDGNSVTPITTAVIPTTINTLNVGSHYTKAENLYLNGRIRRILFWPTHSDNL